MYPKLCLNFSPRLASLLKSFQVWVCPSLFLTFSSLCHVQNSIGLTPFSASWRSIRSRRRFFEKFANERRFEPSVPDNWYSQKLEQLSCNTVYIREEVNNERLTLIRVLRQLFPTIRTAWQTLSWICFLILDWTNQNWLLCVCFMLYLILLSPYLSISYIPSVPSIPDYLIHSLFFSLLQLLIYYREAYEIRQPVCMIKL